MTTQESDIVFIADATDPDNLAALLMALFFFGERVKCVIVTGRPSHPDRNASRDEYDIEYSKQVLRWNTRRIKGFLRREGWGRVFVCEGLIPPRTLVSHSVHVDERAELDLYGDYERQYGRSDRTFEDAVVRLRRLRGQIDLIVGGPLTEVAELLEIQEIKSKLRMMTCQLGIFGFGEGVTTIDPDGLTFNAAAHPAATAFVLREFPGELTMVPTNVTKRHDVGFDTADQMRRLGVCDELVEISGIFQQCLPPGSRIYPHDVHAACAMAWRHGLLQLPTFYTRTEVRVTSVGPKGQIGVEFDVTVTDQPKRWVVTDVHADAFLKVFGEGCGARR